MMMEFEFPLTLIILVVSSLFIVFMLLQKSGTHNSSSSSSSLLLNRIPGPKRLPLIGNLHLLAGKSPPHHVFRELAAKYGPLMRLQLGGVPFIIVSSVEVAKQVLKTHDTVFANRPPVLALKKVTYNSTDIGTAPYGEYWRQLKRICTLELLSGRRVRSFRPIREEVINSSTAQRIASNEGSPVNLTEILSQSSFDITVRASVGEETEEKRAMCSAMKDALKLGSGLSIADLYPSNTLLPLITALSFKINRIFGQTDRILQRILDAHRAAKGAMERSEDLVDVLLKYQRDEAEVHLTDDNIKAVIMDMFLAGADTSSTTVEWAMSEMVRNPTTLKRAQDEVRRVFDDKGYVDEKKFDELKYLKLVIKEALRLHPTGPLLVPRESSEGCEINGYEIPAKTRVVVNAWAMGTDAKYWKEAEKFMPERFEDSSIDFIGNNLEYIPFGAGRRMCPGMSFGLANVEFLLAMLLYHFNWKMPNGMKAEELDMSEDLGLTLTRRHHLLLIPTLKRPLVLG